MCVWKYKYKFSYSKVIYIYTKLSTLIGIYIHLDIRSSL